MVLQEAMALKKKSYKNQAFTGEKRTFGQMRQEFLNRVKPIPIVNIVSNKA